MNPRLKEILERKAAIKRSIDNNEEIDLDAIEKEVEELTNEETQIRKKMSIAHSLETNEIEPQHEEEIDEESEEDGPVKRKKNMSAEVRSFLRYMMSGGRETRGVTLENGQAVVPDELANEIITEMREVSDIMTFINIKNVRGNLTVGDLTSIEANSDKDGDTIQAKGGVTGEITFASYRTSAKIELGVGLDAESIDAFKDTVIEELALSLAIEVEKQITANTQKTGVAESLFAADIPASQKMQVEKSSFGHKQLAAIKGKIRNAYGKRASYVVNTNTFYELIEGMTGTTGHPIYNEENGTLLKKPLILSDEAPANKILFGYGKRYWYNYNMAPQIASSDQEKFSDGMIVHRALAFGDGKVMDKRAFAILEITDTNQVLEG